MTSDPQRLLVYRRAIGNFGLVPVWFDAAVLDRYRAQPGAKVIRSNSVGRVRGPAGWSIDFGIADDDRLIHLTLAELAERLPTIEQAHWLAHLKSLPLSANFLMMRLSSGACIDDGDIRDW